MEHYGFFDGPQYYGQEELARYFDNIYESGIAEQDNLQNAMFVDVSGTTIQVGSGFAIIRGYYLYSDSVKSIPVTRNANYDRIDRVVIRLSLSSKKVSIEHKQGTAGSNPKPPDLQRDNLIYELSLAQVRVPKSGNLVVTDERYRQDLYGVIRPKNMTEFNSMIRGMTEEFDRWFESQQGLGWRNIYIQQNEPSEVVTGSIWIQELV